MAKKNKIDREKSRFIFFLNTKLLLFFKRVKKPVKTDKERVRRKNKNGGM